MLNIVCALKCEADPMIRAWGLKKSTQRHPFPLYTGPDISLIVTGTGGLNAAAGCAYLHGLKCGEAAAATGSGTQDMSPAAWLNVGVAGHALEALGAGFLVLKVVDAASGQAWYPVWPGRLPCAAAELTTVVEEDRDYRHATLIDMEAAALMAVVSRFVTLEFVHCYKIVSDNRIADAGQVTAAGVSALVEHRLAEIETLAGLLTERVEQEQAVVAPPRDFADLLAQHSFSFTQRQQLRTLLYQWQALSLDSAAERIRSGQCRSAGQLLAALRRGLQQLPVDYPEI